LLAQSKAELSLSATKNQARTLDPRQKHTDSMIRTIGLDARDRPVLPLLLLISAAKSGAWMRWLIMPRPGELPYLKR